MILKLLTPFCNYLYIQGPLTILWTGCLCSDLHVFLSGATSSFWATCAASSQVMVYSVNLLTQRLGSVIVNEVVCAAIAMKGQE